MLTGVIYGAIVVVWAAYLVPLALRRHDEANRSRSIARFSSAMRVLARRGTTVAKSSVSSRRVVVTPPRPMSGSVTPEPAVAAAPGPRRPRPSRAAERAAAARRRQVLAILGGVAFLTGAVSILGWLPSWSILLPLALITAFLVIARRQVRAADDAYWASVSWAVADQPESTSIVVRRSAVRVDSSRPSAEDEQTVTVAVTRRREVEEEHVVAVPLATPEGGSLWDPIPVSKPAPVTVPAARRTLRTVDLGGAAQRTSESPDSADERDDAPAIARAVNG